MISQLARTPFLPSDLAEVYLWLRADSVAKVLNAAGNRAVSGEKVDQWSSEVGSFDFQNTTDDERPVYRDDGTGANNRPYLKFTTADDTRLTRAGQLTTHTQGECFIVCQNNNRAANSNLFCIGLTSASTPHFEFHQAQDNGAQGSFKITTDLGVVTPNDETALDGPAQLGNWRSDDADVTMFKGDVSILTTPVTREWLGDLTAANQIATIGALTRTTPSGWLDGKIFEILLTTTLSAEKRARLIHYLRSKYALQEWAALGGSQSNKTATGTDAYWFKQMLSGVDTPQEGISYIEHATGGWTTANGLTEWTNNIRGKGYYGLSIVIGTNDAATDVPAATAIANLKRIIDEALADRLRVVIMELNPFGAAGGWNPNRQKIADTIDAWIRSYVAADITGLLALLPADFLRDSTNPQLLAARYDSGDGIHWAEPEAHQAVADHLAPIMAALR